VILITVWWLQNVGKDWKQLKKAGQKFDGGRLNLRKLNEMEVMKHYQIEITNRFATLEYVRDSEDINRVWENIKKNIKTSVKDSLVLHELKQHSHGLMMNV
jgi:hypothetical protein